VTVQPEALLAELMGIMEARGIELRWERFGGDAATCTVRGETVVFLDPGLSLSRQIASLARELRHWDWRNIYLKPRIRRLLEGEE